MSEKSDNDKKKILIVEDERQIVDIVAFNLRREGYAVVSAHDGEKGYEMFVKEKPDLILLDLMMPKMNGFELCKKIRLEALTPIIMLTAKVEEVDKVLGLELGADDYVTKPFSNRELIARIKANLRRSEPPAASASNALVFGDLTIDMSKYEISRNGEIIALTHIEYELAKFLAMQPQKVFSRETLLEKVWGYDFIGDVRTVDVTIRRLRQKLEELPDKPIYILTKRSVGYYFGKA